MMVNRRHAENAFPAQFKRADLQDHAERFDDENTANEKEQNFLLDDDRDNAERTAERKRSDVPHENFSGVRVVPEETEGSADKRAAKNGEFTYARNVLNFEIAGPTVVAADVGQNRERTGSNDSTANREAVQTIREIYRVRSARNDNCYENKKRNERKRPEVFGIDKRMDDQVRMHAFKEWKNELRGIRAVCRENEKRRANNEADKDLKGEFALGRQAEILLLGDFCVIIDETDCCKREKREQGDENKSISQIRPKENGNGSGKNDKHAAHGGRAGFFLVLLWALFANVLSDLQFPQAANEPRAEDEREKHCREARIDRSNGDVAKHVQRAEVTLQNLIKEEVKHPSAEPPRVARA